MAGCPQSTHLGLTYLIKSNDKVVLKKYVGSDDIYHICFQREKTRRKGEYVYEIMIEVKGEELAKEILETTSSKVKDVDYLSL